MLCGWGGNRRPGRLAKVMAAYRRVDDLYPVYTIQPVVNNRLYRVNKHPTGCQTVCQTGLTTGLTTVLNERPLFVQLFVQPVVKPG